RQTAQVAVVQVQRMPPGNDRLIVEQAGQRVIGAEQGQGHPTLPGRQAEQDQKPGPMVPRARLRLSVRAPRGTSLHRAATISTARDGGKPKPFVDLPACGADFGQRASYLASQLLWQGWRTWH